MAHREAELKMQLMKACRELHGFVIFPHQDVRRIGVPDLSVTGHHKTSWLEVKHGTPRFDSPKLQEITMLRLDAAGYARYIIYMETPDGGLKRVLIVHPNHIHDLLPDAWSTGFDHAFVVNYIRMVHNR